MSDTPRTDSEHGKTLTPEYEYVGAESEAWEWARKLEREAMDFNRLELKAEEVDCVHLCLDDHHIPTEIDGETLSLWGRVCILAGLTSPPGNI